MEFVNVFLQSFIFGVLSNQIGGFIGFWFKLKREENINKTMGFTAGITTAIICFELLNESFSLSNKYLVVIYTLIGVFLVKVMDIIINKLKKKENKQNSIVIVSAISAHNITEGLAIGSAFGISSALGISLLMAIMLHNIPEGMIIGITCRKEHKKFREVMNNCIIIGVFLGFGALIGNVIGTINSRYMMPCLAVSAGAMLYIVACELIPEMHSDRNNNIVGIFYTVGFLIGCIMCMG